MHRDAAFTVLLLCGVSAVIALPPPTDVTVTCHNLSTTVSWKYSEQPETRFRVRVKGSDAKFYEYETTKHQYDVSHFIWESEENFMDYHYITVTAILGGNQSEPAQSKSFSFNRLKTTHIKCHLNFPPVNLTVDESGPTVSFQNPFKYFNISKQDGASFKFSVSAGDKRFDASCTVEDTVCRHTFSFPDGGEQYVTLNGTLCSRDCLGQVVFNKTEHIYPSNAANVLVVTLALMLGILAFVIIVVTVAICREKAWTMWTVKGTPESLNFDKPNEQESCLLVPREQTEYMVILTDQTPSVSSEDPSSNYCGGCSSGSQTSEEDYRDGGLLENSNQEVGCGACGTDDSFTDDSGETECVSVNSEEEMNHGYERREFPVDMGDGDMATGYSWK